MKLRKTPYVIVNYVVICTIFLMLVSCAASEPSLSSRYPKKPGDTTERKAGRAMMFYEQAEKDLDVNQSVIVVEPPPAENKESKENSSISQ